ncbi:MAG: PDGLE domain-containing protein [Dehalococcoidales bacterium]|nr:PDGLE domain-containing protein [Dehalococcoidales bacterium]
MKSKWWLAALVVCLAVAIFSPLASSSPDGLEKVAEDKGFIDMAGNAPFRVIADYIFPGIQNEAVATIIAGIIGTLVLFGVAYGLAYLLVYTRKKKFALNQER